MITNNPNVKESELEKFARCFHQDFGLMAMSPEQFASEYLQLLSKTRNLDLKKQLLELCESYPGKDGKSLRKAWESAGAQWWSQSLDLREFIKGICKHG